MEPKYHQNIFFPSSSSVNVVGFCVCAHVWTQVFSYIFLWPVLACYLRYEDMITLKNQLQMDYIELKAYLQFLVLLTETGRSQSLETDVSTGQEESRLLLLNKK